MPGSSGPRLPGKPASDPVSKTGKRSNNARKVSVKSKNDMPPLADERPQLIRWIGVDSEGRTFPTSREHAAGFELSEPISDELPPLPVTYWKGRRAAPR